MLGDWEDAQIAMGVKDHRDTEGRPWISQLSPRFRGMDKAGTMIRPSSISFEITIGENRKESQNQTQASGQIAQNQPQEA